MTVITLPTRPHRPRKGERKPIRTGRAARTRVGTFNSPARRAANLVKVADRVNTGKVTTADYLRQLGADDAFVTSYASPYGRTVAKVYRSEHGAEPVKSGLAARGRKLVPVFAYSADDATILEKAAREYRRTAELVAQRTEATAAPEVSGNFAETSKPQPATVAPAALVAEMAERYELPAGFAAQRVEAILASMRSNPRLFDAQRGLLAPGGAAVVRSIFHAEDAEGMLRRESEAWQAVQPGARVSLLVSDTADRVTGTVRAIARNAIGQDVAEVELPGGTTTHQATRFLTAA